MKKIRRLMQNEDADKEETEEQAEELEDGNWQSSILSCSAASKGGLVFLVFRNLFT